MREAVDDRGETHLPTNVVSRNTTNREGALAIYALLAKRSTKKTIRRFDNKALGINGNNRLGRSIPG